jgi:hypothetical protein
MIQTAKLALSLAVPLLLHVPLLAQQAQDSLGHSAPRLEDVATQFAALNVVDGVLTGAGAGYRARFDSDGVQFVPALGEAAPTEQPVQVRGVAYGRGIADRSLAQVMPSHRGQQVTFAHGAVDTTYVVQSDGIKQSFVFHERPAGRGDLVVAVQVASQLAATQLGDDAVVLQNELGGVRIAGVLGIDAAGDTVRGTLQWQGSSLLLRLPAAFVEGAALPLVLDPFLAPEFSVVSSSRNLDPQVAYDAGTNRYLVAWWRRLSASTADVYGQFVFDVTTTPSNLAGSSVVIRSGQNSLRARVANCSLRNCFVVGWQETVATPPLPNHSDVFVRAVNATLQGPAFALSPTPSNETGLELSGDATESNGSVFAAFLSGTVATTITVNVATNLVVTGSAQAPISGGNSASRIRLPKSGGSDNRRVVAFQSSSTGNVTLRTYAGSSAVGAAVTMPATFDVTDFAIDGDGDNWAVAWMEFESSTSVTNDIRVGTYEWIAATNTLQLLATGGVATTAFLEEGRPSVALIDRNVVVAWVAPGTTSELRMRTFTLSSCSECEQANVVASSSSNLSSAIASQASGNETSANRRDALLVWNVDNGTTSTIGARRWQPADGLLTTIPSGCGNLTGVLTEECAATGSTGHRAMLRNVAAGATGWLLLSPDRNDALGCGSCVLVPDLWNCFAFGPLVPNAQGHLTATTPIPASLLLVGRSYYQQWVVADTATPGCSTFFFDLSNAQQVTIQ